MRYYSERVILYSYLIAVLIAVVLLVSLFVLKILFPEWGFTPKVILFGTIVATLAVAVILIIYRRKKYVEYLLNG